MPATSAETSGQPPAWNLSCDCSTCKQLRQQQPLFGEADGYDGAGYDAHGYDRQGYDNNGYDRRGANEDGYDADGNPRYVYAGDLNLEKLWDTFVPVQPSRTLHLFLAYLREITRDPDAIDDVCFCVNCSCPAWKQDTFPARGNHTEPLCENCAGDWACCDRCASLYPDSEITRVLDDDSVCDLCRRAGYSYCNYCEGWYPDDDADEHDHTRYDDCCTSPQLEFTIRNDGCEPLANDTRVTVALPAGTISTEGLKEIQRYLYAQYYGNSLYYDLDCLGDQWQAKGGNYAKRLSAHAYKNYQTKLTPEILSRVGVIARDHSNPVSTTVEVTRDLNQPPDAFYHEDSCWWQTSYGDSRCTLKTNGGFGLRTFKEYDKEYDRVSGRAWVLPLRQDEHGQLNPTFNTLTPDAFVVFNGYGELSGYAAPRILAHMTGWTYRKISFRCEPMYVNAGGYLIAPEEIAQRYANDGLRLSVHPHADLFNREQAEKETTNARA